MVMSSPIKMKVSILSKSDESLVLPHARAFVRVVISL